MPDARRRRRWPWVIGGLALALLVIASVFWFAFVPNWRPPLRANEVYGIDVSAHQGAIDWERVASDNVAFAYLKATEGGDFVDARFHENWSGAVAAGLDRGAYHFFTLCRPGAEQARHFLAVAAPDPRALPPAVDLETAGNCGARPSRRHVLAEVRAFLDAVEAAWHRPVIVYSRADWESRYPVRALGRPRWRFRFLRRPSGDWRVWQIHGFAHIDGVAGRVDLDARRLSTA